MRCWTASRQAVDAGATGRVARSTPVGRVHPLPENFFENRTRSFFSPVHRDAFASPCVSIPILRATYGRVRTNVFIRVGKLVAKNLLPSCFVLTEKALSLPSNWFLLPRHTGRGLKGNRVKVPNSPAAVKLHFKRLDNYSLPLMHRASGRLQDGSQSEDLPSFIQPSGLRG